MRIHNMFFYMLGNKGLIISYTLLPENHTKSYLKIISKVKCISYYEKSLPEKNNVWNHVSCYTIFKYWVNAFLQFYPTDVLLSHRPKAKARNAWTPHFLSAPFTFHKRIKVPNTFQFRPKVKIIITLNLN